MKITLILKDTILIGEQVSCCMESEPVALNHPCAEPEACCTDACCIEACKPAQLELPTPVTHTNPAIATLAATPALAQAQAQAVKTSPCAAKVDDIVTFTMRVDQILSRSGSG